MMQAPSWTDFLQCSVCTNHYNTTSVLPISLSCGHSICKKCLTEFMTRVCPYDKTAISPNAELLPPNSALLRLLGAGKPDKGEEDVMETCDFSVLGLPQEDLELFKASRNSIKDLAVYLQPLAEPGAGQVIHYLTRPMLKKLVTVVSCQFLEADGRARVLRAARSITDRTVTELLVMHQNQQQISTLLWSAIRSRGCQFLGPVMQEEALKLILKVLEGGAFLSRKNIVLYVVQQLQQLEFHQASKTSIGHVVQLLYRASCFNVEKRDEDSSRMQLKEEFRTYEALRREHDAQIIRVAMESGLRISPEQWSALLYGDQKHKSDMQSIIDKLLSLGIATSGLSELIVAIRRSQDQHSLLEKIVPHLEKLLRVDINIDKSSPEVERWLFFSDTMAALVATLHEYSSFMRIQSGRYKTGLCPNLTKPGGCPKGDKCTYAHTEEEREKYRYLARGAKNKSRDLGKPVSGPQSIPSRTGSGRWSGDIGAKLDSSPFSSLGQPSYDGLGHVFPSGGSQGYPSGGGAIAEGYPDYSTLPAAAVGSATAPIVLQQVVRQPPTLTSDPAIPVIPAQPQLVAYRSPHHSGPLTVSGEQLAVFDTQVDPAYFTAARRSGSIPDEYSMVGVASDVRGYSASAQTPLHHPSSYLTAAPPAALESIKQVHADIKKNLQPHYFSDKGTQADYTPSTTDLPYLHSDGGRGGGQGLQYDAAFPQEPLINTTTSANSTAASHYHDNGHAPSEQQVASSVSVSSTAGFLAESGPGGVAKGEEPEAGEGAKVTGGEGDGNRLSGQMSQLRLKDHAYHEATPYSSTVGGVSGDYVVSAESYSQYSMPHSGLYLSSSSSSSSSTLAHTRLVDPHSLHHQPLYTTVGEDVRSAGVPEPARAAGGVSELDLMREKIRQLETQLAREKARAVQQVSGSPLLQPQQHHSPAHSGLVYGSSSVDGYQTSQVQPYAAAAPRVQQVQVFPPGSASHQPAAYYTPTPATPTYPFANWSGPQYSGELSSSLQTVPGHVSTGYVLHQPGATPQQAMGRSVYVQHQSQQPMVQDRDHMLAMYLQIQEQAKQLHQPHPAPTLTSYTPSQPHSAQMGYGGGAYTTPNSFIPSTGTPYFMKPY